MRITIAAETTATPEQCWKAATTPQAIKAWNAANDDWHCPSAELDLRVGGRMKSRMEAKDGSMGFDFAATFTRIDAPRRLEYRLDDERMVELRIDARDGGSHVTQSFDAETENDPEFQRAGWQAILDGFVKYAEQN